MTDEPSNLNEQLSAFLDGELPPAAAAELERRLANDPALRIELEELAEVKRLVGHLPRVQAPPAVRMAIRAQLERRSLLHPSDVADSSSRSWIRFVRVTTAAAMLMIVGTLGYVVFRHVNPGVGPSNPQPVGPRVDSPMERLARSGSSDVDGSPAPSAAAIADPRATGGGSADRRRDDRDERPDGGLPTKAAQATPADSMSKGRAEVDGNLHEEAVSLSRQLKDGPITAAAVQNRSFEPEPFILNVPAESTAQQEQIVNAVRKTLQSNGAVPVDQLNAKDRLTADDHQFYLQGQANKNFGPSANHETQIVARVRRSVAEEVAAQAADTSGGQARFQMRSREKSKEFRGEAAQIEGIGRKSLGQARLELAREDREGEYKQKDASAANPVASGKSDRGSRAGPGPDQPAGESGRAGDAPPMIILSPPMQDGKHTGRGDEKQDDKKGGADLAGGRSNTAPTSQPAGTPCVVAAGPRRNPGDLPARPKMDPSACPGSAVASSRSDGGAQGASASGDLSKDVMESQRPQDLAAPADATGGWVNMVIQVYVASDKHRATTEPASEEVPASQPK